VQVATPPTASEFCGGITGITLRPVSGADIVSLITDEHLLHFYISGARAAPKRNITGCKSVVRVICLAWRVGLRNRVEVLMCIVHALKLCLGGACLGIYLGL